MNALSENKNTETNDRNLGTPGKEVDYFAQLLNNTISGIPGTRKHAEKKAGVLFSNDVFSHDDLTTGEHQLLQESIDDKYAPAILEGARSRYAGLLIGAIAPYEFLLLGLVLLSGSANSTTGAWYSITLKEMKQKFEGMGLSLTSKLLSADVSANALATYAGIGFAYRALIYNYFMNFCSNPTSESFIKLAGGIGVTLLTHSKLERILGNKEIASIQFDFNDATLAGMTEEQQKFFAQSINIVNGKLERLEGDKNDIEIFQTTLGILESLVNLIKGFDIHQKFGKEFKEINDILVSNQDNYDGNIKALIPIIVQVFGGITHICSFDAKLKESIQGKSNILSNKEDDESIKDIIVTIFQGLIPGIVADIEEKGEKIISDGK